MINHLKTVLLLATLTAIFLAIGFLIGGITGLTIAFIIALVINFLSYWFSDKIVLNLYHAKKASNKEYPELHYLVREVSSNASLPKPELYIIPSDSSNAFATGRNPKNSSIAFTRGILSLLDKNELKGVIAHEMAHIRNYDILVSTIAAVIAGAISYIALITRFGAADREGNFFELILLAILAPIIALIIRMAISRGREYLADETGAKIIRNPNALADALSKLNYSSQEKPLKFGNNATSHLFIVNPFSGKSLINLFSTHPPIAERIRRLRKINL